MLWVLITAMTVLAVAATIWPLARPAGEPPRWNDVAVYTDQLDEIGRDQAWGLTAPREAEAARVEVSRRLIAAADAAASTGPARETSPHGRRLVGASALVAVPACALAIYLSFGSPDLPGQPLGPRLAAVHGGGQSVEELLARVEAHLEQHPDDGRGWQVVAPFYIRLGRLDDAVKARQNALRLLGPTAERESDLGETLVLVANGVVTDEAKATFDQALRIDPKDVTARFYFGLAAEQDGRKEVAAGAWRALAADAPEGVRWLPSVQRALARVDPSAAAVARAPGSGDAAAVAVPAEQNDMIRGMVERLATRLHQDGSDVDGWIRLIRSYTVLDDPERARAAGSDARAALAKDPDKLARLEAGIQEIAAAASASASAAASPPRGANDAPPGAEPPASQDQMIRGMVERLATRLQQDGSDVDGWLRLLRSYMVLGEPDSARTALDNARRAVASERDKLERLESGARSLGVGG